MKRLFILSSIILLVGCTITKRQFNSGYRVEWKKPHSKEKNETAKLNLTELKDDSFDEPEKQLNLIVSTVDSTDLIPPKNEELVLDEFVPKEVPSGEIQESEPAEFQNSQIQEKRVQETPEEVDEVERKVDPFTWVALGGILLGLLLLLTIGFGGITSAILIGFGILVIIFSIISIIRILKHPERYKAKGLTWTLFGLSTAGIGLALFILIWYLLVTTHNIDLL